jgi:hypothetical protein
MTLDEEIERAEEALGVKLLGFQRELLKHVLSGHKVVVAPLRYGKATALKVATRILEERLKP